MSMLQKEKQTFLEQTSLKTGSKERFGKLGLCLQENNDEYRHGKEKQ